MTDHYRKQPVVPIPCGLGPPDNQQLRDLHEIEIVDPDDEGHRDTEEERTRRAIARLKRMDSW